MRSRSPTCGSRPPSRTAPSRCWQSAGLAGVEVRDGHVRARLGSALPEDVVAALVRAGVGVRGFAVERASLEEQFVGLTGEGFDVSG